jgi:hypothetical protein
MFKIQNCSYQESVHASIYVQGEKSFMPTICSRLLNVQGRKPFIPRIHSSFYLWSRGETVNAKNPFMLF